MGKYISIMLIIGAFVLGVYVGRMPITSLILGADSTPRATSKAVSSPPAASADGAVIKTTSLPTGQQKLLSALGIDASEIVITPTMIACAEAKVGAARLKEIENGATPSFTEGLSLLVCYR